MCVYSHEHASRKAKAGDALELVNFGHELKGFAEPSRPGIPVCLVPGTTCAISNINPGVQGARDLKETEEVVFMVSQMTDLFIFRDGVPTISLKSLNVGVNLTVVALPGKVPTQPSTTAGNVNTPRKEREAALSST